MKNMENLFLEYYSCLFKSSTCDMQAIDEILRSTNLVVSTAMRSQLDQPFVEDEITTALKQMHPHIQSLWTRWTLNALLP